MSIATFLEASNKLHLDTVIVTTTPDNTAEAFLAVNDGDDWAVWSANADILRDTLSGNVIQIDAPRPAVRDPLRFSSKTGKVYLSIYLRSASAWLKALHQGEAIRNLYYKTNNTCCRFDHLDIDGEEIHVAT